jgi:hypothetical protein
MDKAQKPSNSDDKLIISGDINVFLHKAYVIALYHFSICFVNPSKLGSNINNILKIHFQSYRKQLSSIQLDNNHCLFREPYEPINTFCGKNAEFFEAKIGDRACI